MVQRLRRRPEPTYSKPPSVNTDTNSDRIVETGHSRAAQRSRLVMAERALRDAPDEVRGRADVLGERALVRPRASVHEARDVVPDAHAGGLGRRDAVARPDDDPGEVAPEDAPGHAAVVLDVCAQLQQYSNSAASVSSIGL